MKILRKTVLLLLLSALCWSEASPLNRPDLPTIQGIESYSTFRSSVFSGLGYDNNTGTLQLTFLSGEIYQYYLVPIGEVIELAKADSMGEFFNQRIRNIYAYKRVDAIAEILRQPAPVYYQPQQQRYGTRITPFGVEHY